MSRTTVQYASVTDEALIDRARESDDRAFGELFRRHRDAALRAARAFRGLDADDLVNESFLRIYACLGRGGGPTGAFRPYLYRTIHNVAIGWLRHPSELAVDDSELESEQPVDEPVDPLEQALDRSITARAFRSLPERWQSVLWYTEVEGLDPHEVAPLLGLSANGVAALAYRAREGLRTAWLQAHVHLAGLSGECRWAAEHVGAEARHALSDRDHRRVLAHLNHCTRCAIVAEEVDDIGSRLALVLLPLILGGVAGGALLSDLHRGAGDLTAASAPELATAPVEAAAATGGFLSSALSMGAVAIAPVLLVGGTIIGIADRDAPPAETVAAETSTSVGPSTSDDLTPGGEPAPIATEDEAALSDEGDGESSPTPTDGTNPDARPDSLIEPPVPETPDIPVITDELEAIEEVISGVVDTVIAGDPPAGHTAPGGVVGADIDLVLDGTATPGATLSLQAAGQLYATTTVDADGTFRLHATAIPSGIEQLALVQAVDRAYLERLLPGTSGLLGGVLGTVDDAIEAIIDPVSITTQSVAGIRIETG